VSSFAVILSVPRCRDPTVLRDRASPVRSSTHPCVRHQNPWTNLDVTAHQCAVRLSKGERSWVATHQRPAHDSVRLGPWDGVCPAAAEWVDPWHSWGVRVAAEWGDPMN